MDRKWRSRARFQIWYQLWISCFEPKTIRVFISHDSGHFWTFSKMYLKKRKNDVTRGTKIGVTLRLPVIRSKIQPYHSIELRCLYIYFWELLDRWRFDISFWHNNRPVPYMPFWPPGLPEGPPRAEFQGERFAPRSNRPGWYTCGTLPRQASGRERVRSTLPHRNI